jgi:hypothetical protein
MLSSTRPESGHDRPDASTTYVMVRRLDASDVEGTEVDLTVERT